MKMYDMANRVAGHLARETRLEQSKVDRVRFGLELLFGEIIKWVVLLSISAPLGLLPEALAALAGFSLFRLVSGGPHCEDYWRCLVFSILVILVPAFLGVIVAPYLTGSLVIKIILAGAVVMIAMVVIWAPGEVPQRKIKPGERGFFKGFSLIFLALWTVILIVFITSHNVSLAVAGFLGTTVQAFTFTPLGYRAIEIFDIILSKIIGERRCETHAENA